MGNGEAVISWGVRGGVPAAASVAAPQGDRNQVGEAPQEGRGQIGEAAIAALEAEERMMAYA